MESARTTSRRTGRSLVNALLAVLLVLTAGTLTVSAASAAAGDSLVGSWDREYNSYDPMRFTVSDGLSVRFSYKPQCGSVYETFMWTVVKTSSNVYTATMDKKMHDGNCGVTADPRTVRLTVFDNGMKLRIEYTGTDADGYPYVTHASYWNRTPGSAPSPSPTTSPAPQPNADVAVLLDVVSPGLAGPGVLNGRNYRVDAYVRNLSTTTTAHQVRVPFTLNGLTVISATPTVGTFSGSTWTIGSLSPGIQRRIILQLKTPIGTGLKAANLVANVSSSTPDLKLVNNRKAETLVSSSGPFAKNDGGCTSGTLQSRNRVSTVNPEGYRTDGWWRQVFRSSAVRVTMTWTGVCMASDGRLLSAGSYNVTAAGQNGWTLISVGGPQCVRDHNMAHCNRYVVLQAPQGWLPETLELAGQIGITVNGGLTQAALNLGVTLNPNVSFRSVWNNEQRTIRLPISMFMHRGGCTWAAGAGSTSLPGSCNGGS